MPATYTDEDLGIGSVLSDADVGLEAPPPATNLGDVLRQPPQLVMPPDSQTVDTRWSGLVNPPVMFPPIPGASAQLPTDWKPRLDASQMLVGPDGMKRESGMESGTGLITALGSSPVGQAALRAGEALGGQIGETGDYLGRAWEATGGMRDPLAGIEALAQPIAKAAGYQLGEAGKALWRPFGEMAGDRPTEEGGSDWEQLSKQYPKLMALPQITKGFVESAPKMAAQTLLGPELGPAVWGLTDEGFDAGTAATMYVLPWTKNYAGAIAENVASKMGIQNDLAKQVVNRVAGGTAMAGLLTADQINELSRLSPEERSKKAPVAIGNALAMFAMGTLDRGTLPDKAPETTPDPKAVPPPAPEPVPTPPVERTPATAPAVSEALPAVPSGKGKSPSELAADVAVEEISAGQLADLREKMGEAGQGQAGGLHVVIRKDGKVIKRAIFIDKDLSSADKAEFLEHERRHAQIDFDEEQGGHAAAQAEEIVKLVADNPHLDPELHNLIQIVKGVGYRTSEVAKELLAEGILDFDNLSEDLAGLKNGKGGIGVRALEQRAAKKRKAQREGVPPPEAPAPAVAIATEQGTPSESLKGGAESGLSPEAQAKSRANNSLRSMAAANGVEFVEGDTAKTIFAKINAKTSKPAVPAEHPMAGKSVDELIAATPEEFLKWQKAGGKADKIAWGEAKNDIAANLSLEDANKLQVHLDENNKSLSTRIRDAEELMESARKEDDPTKKQAEMNKWLESLNKIQQDQIKANTIQDVLTKSAEKKSAAPPATAAEPTPPPAAAPVAPGGKPAEPVPVAAAKIEQAVTDQITTESVPSSNKGAKQARTILIREIQKLYDEAPTQAETHSIPSTSESGEVTFSPPEKPLVKVTIDIPGDGERTVFKTKENLEYLLKRVKGIKTSPPKGYKESIPAAGIPPDVWVQSSEPTHMVEFLMPGDKVGQMKGKPITLESKNAKGQQFYLTSNGEQFRVTEARTGTGVGDWADTVSGALKNAEARSDALPNQTKSIEDYIKKHGERAKPEPITPEPKPAAPGKGIASDWTSATEEVPPPKPGEPPTASLVNPPTGPTELHAGIPVPKFANRKMSPLDKVTAAHSGKLQKSFDEARRAQREIKAAVPSDRRQNAISIWREAKGDVGTLKGWASAAKGKMFRQAAIDAQTLTPKEIAIATKAGAAFDALHARGTAFDVLSSHRDAYVPHVWDVAKPGSGWGGGMLKQRFRFSKARTFDTFFDGDQAGFKPKTLAIGKLLPAYIHEMNKVIADRQAVRDIVAGTNKDGSPMAVPRGNAKVVEGDDGKAVLVQPRAMKEADTSDYRVMSDQPALANWTWASKDTAGRPVFIKSDLALHPDAYRRINAMLGQSELRKWYHDPVTGTAQIPRAIVRGLDTAQSAMKREMFGLLAPFHQVQEGTHGIGHMVNPFSHIPKIDLRDPAQLDAANHGLMMLPDRASARSYIEGVGAKSSLLSQGIRKLGRAGEVVSDVIDGYQDYLFHQYIPGLKFKTYQAMLGRNMKLYADELKSGEMTPADVKITSAEQANAAYGHLNYSLLDRNPTIQHLIQMSTLAPDFFEARSRFAGQAFKGMSSKVGHEQLKAIAILAAVQASSAYIISNVTGGQYDPHHPFEVIHNGRRYAMRSVPEDIFSLLKDTRQFAYSRVNPLTVKGGIQLATGLNYRGEKVTPIDTFEELLAGYIPITARQLPGLRSLTETSRQNPVSPLQQLAGSLGLRISRYSPVSETYKLAGKWMDAQKLDRSKGSYPISKYQQLRYALEDGDLDRAKTEYDALLKTATPAKIKTGFKESTNHPFTGKKSTDETFAASLSGYDKQLYLQALRTRTSILQSFDKLPTLKSPADTRPPREQFKL